VLCLGGRSGDIAVAAMHIGPALSRWSCAYTQEFLWPRVYRTPAEIAAEAAAAARRAQVPCLHLLLCIVPSNCLLGKHVFHSF
jgi:hypothetical protein